MVKNVAKSSGYEDGIIVAIFCSVICFLIAIFSGFEVMIKFVTIVYPCYKSVLAIESDEPEDDKAWLAYWIVFGLTPYYDATIGRLFSGLPFYWLGRGLFHIWLMLPMTRGALVIYYSILSPIYQRNQSKINMWRDFLDEKINLAEK